MLKDQLKQAALSYFKIPKHYKLFIEDFEDDTVMLLWKEETSEDGYYIEFDQLGKLLSLSQPASNIGEQVPIGEQQRIAEQFLIAHYAEALDYYTLSNTVQEQDRTKFRFEQFVGGQPLVKFYCFIEIGHNGQVLDFNFKGYTKNPPSVPEKLQAKEMILTNLFEAEWTASMAYLSKESYTVPCSGLYVMYESPIVHSTFDAATGADFFANDNKEIIDDDVFVPVLIVAPNSREETIEKIVGITPSMKIVQQSKMDEDKLKIIWREQNYTAPNDKTMNSFIEDRFEQTVKVIIETSTYTLKDFVWFKERTGELDLSFEKCQNIAISFISTYYREYVPYLQMKVEQPSFNSANRAFFNFTLFLEEYPLYGEGFRISVNKTTGFIDMLMTPRISTATIEAYTSGPILDLSKAKQTLEDVDAILEWARNYQSDTTQEILRYTFVHHPTRKRIKGINAVTGELILTKY